jgi:hypothetical protein
MKRPLQHVRKVPQRTERQRTPVCCLPGHSYFCALEKAVSSTSPIGCHVRPSN